MFAKFQVDLELSFTTMEGVMKLIEDLIFASWPALSSPIPFPRMSYKDAMINYGTDKPDVRFEMLVSFLYHYPYYHILS